MAPRARTVLAAAAASPAPLAAAEAATAAPVKEGAELDGGLLAALERYGVHCKAAYIMYEQFTDNGDSVPGMQEDDVLAQANKGSKSTETPVGLTDESAGYKHLGHMRGYACAGNVFVMPTPDVKAAAAAAANAGGAAATAAPAASLLEQGLALLRSWGLDRWLGKPELAKPTYLGYIAEGKGADGVDEMLVAFRGSSSTSDWIMNLLGGVAAADLYGAGNGKVHQGFHNMVHDWPTNKSGGLACTEEKTPSKCIDEAIKAYELSHGKKPDRIICTGHSLGGALATLAAAHIAINFEEYYNKTPNKDEPYTQRPLQVYTFAAPRVGDATLRGYFKDTLHVEAVQLKNTEDPVPYVAPAQKEVLSVLGKAIGRTQQALQDTPTQPQHGPPVSKVQKYKEVLSTLHQLNDVATQLEFGDVSGPGLLTSLWDAATYLLHLGPAAPAEPGHAMPFWRRRKYQQELLGTFGTAWCDNAAPEGGFGCFGSSEGGKWGGAMHSLEVYLKNIRKCMVPVPTA